MFYSKYMNFCRKTYLLAQFQTIIYITSEFNFVKDIKQFFADFKNFHFLKVYVYTIFKVIYIRGDFNLGNDLRIQRMAAFTFNKNPLGETECLNNLQFLFTGCPSIHFFDSLSFFNRVSQATFGYLPLTVQHQCYLQDAIPFHWSPVASHATPLEDSTMFLGVRSILSMCLHSHT